MLQRCGKQVAGFVYHVEKTLIRIPNTWIRNHNDHPCMICKGSIYVVIDESVFADLQFWSPILTKRFNLDRTLTQISRDSFLDSIHDTIFKKFDQPYFKKSNESPQIFSTINTSNPYESIRNLDFFVCTSVQCSKDSFHGFDSSYSLIRSIQCIRLGRKKKKGSI